MNRNSFTNLYPVTSFLLLLNVGFYILQMLGHDMGAVQTAHIQKGEYWRLISGTFMHGPWWHIGMNCMILLDLGRFCEPLLSKSKFFSIYTLSALGGSVSTYIWEFRIYLQNQPFDQWAPILLGLQETTAGQGAPSIFSGGTVGCSGAIAGLVGMMLVYSIKEHHPALRSMLLRWILWVALITFLLPNISHSSHIGGLVIGAICGLTATDYATSATSLRWRIPAGLTGLALVTSLGWAVYKALLS